MSRTSVRGPKKALTSIGVIYNIVSQYDKCLRFGRGARSGCAERMLKGCTGSKSGSQYMACVGGSTYSLPLEVDKAIEFCGQTTNEISFYFY